MGRNRLGGNGKGGRAAQAFAIAAVVLALAACSRNVPLPGGGGTMPPVPPVPPTSCQVQPYVPQRIVRLTLLEAANALGTLLSQDLASLVRVQQGLNEPTQAYFPPLESTREGDTIFDGRLQQTEMIAAASGQYVADHFADVTACDAGVDCVRAYLGTFAERAYRRPLAPAETDSLNQEISDLLSLGSSAQELAQYGVYAVLMAPGFLYRTELGDPSSASAAPSLPSVALTSYEMASQLAFMLTDAPPDAPLLDAANQGTLATDAGIAAEVDRLLATAGAQRNLGDAVSTNLGINLLGNVVIDPLHVPAYSSALADAMVTESRMFLDDVLWHGQLGDMLTSTTSFVNTDLATIVYGIPVPTGATTTDFVRVLLPAEQRAGLLTRAGFITARARTDIGSDLARAIVIGSKVACDIVPPPPDSFAVEEAAIGKATGGWTQRAQEEQRLSLPECSGCHARIDPYGLALEGYDIIGRTRTQDEQGQPVDSSATLPPAFDNQPVKDGVDLSRKLAQSHTFVACLAQSFLHYGLALLATLPALDSCAVDDITARFAAAPDQTFAGLLREIARSPAMTRRLIAR